jgi:hypothetical protein
MKENVDRRASMIVNFDSTEQIKEWHAIEKEHGLSHMMGRELWLGSADQHVCERILNTHPEFVRHFAGILRTAYMYCPRIVLTDTQLFDGIFFLALGPKMITDILGTSYKDKPAIVISGREDSLEDSLVACMSKCINEGKETPLRTVRSFQNSTLDAFISEGKSSEFTDHCAVAFTRDLLQASDGHRKADVIAEAYATILNMGGVDEHTRKGANSKDANDDPSFLSRDHPRRLLGQRWQEWLNAENQGLIVYENQNSSTAETHVQDDEFDKTLKLYGPQYAKILRDKYAAVMEQKRSEIPESKITPANESSTFGNQFNPQLQPAIAYLSRMTRRTAAFAYIDNKVALPSDGSRNQHITREILRDWYQFIYMKTMARHLGVYLMAVNVPDNSFVQIAGQHSQDTSMTLAGKITDTLGEMPFIRFTSFRYECRSAIRRWQECSPSTPKRERKFRTKTISYLIEQASKERDLASDAKNVLKGTVIAALIALLTALADNIWVNGSTPIWLIVCIAWVLAIIPNIIDAAQWVMGVESSKQTVAFANE